MNRLAKLEDEGVPDISRMGDSLLPYGDTLHYPTCGCPPGWQNSTRAADIVDLLAQQAFKGYQAGRLVATRPLRVLYFLPHHNVTGGMKCLVEHIRLLKIRGHTVIAAHRSETADRAMPPWTRVEASVDVVCRLHQRINDVYDVTKIDVVVVGIFHQVAELLVGVPAPILYWEQGHEWLFGDPVRFQVAHNYQRQDQLFHKVLHLPVALAAVSEAVRAILQRQFGRSSLLIPNGVDCDRFFPGPPAAVPPTAALTSPSKGQEKRGEEHAGRRSVLLVGNPALPLKGFDVALAVLSMVNRVLPLDVTWICQTHPTSAMVSGLASCGLRISLHVSPSQELLPALYRGHDALLFTSRYEAWGMPVLEAMASGLACVATNCLGVQTFAQHGVNALLADTQDVEHLARLLLTVLVEDSLRQRLAIAARATALQFAPSIIADRLEAVLYSLTAGAQDLLHLRTPALADLHAACAAASLACAKPAAPAATSSSASSSQVQSRPERMHSSETNLGADTGR
ncbi:UDP-Glycosyltransferase/glycogen phosphorylase [Coccomyxa subellipsoidea C-169]|uniref:UDP-Glycosyltransferase/glycogen phosphorylase n=1 Tax=Coccomyxa subellipsoidea (strain C-169) TaxID=574566 RepID=I0YUX9_COCSC|nr:UDP-Glycosyltransferase/glycogen phosphorylase [Coccomyxa subellipsoidea C-169]EIE22198.1 UDP-Glycosyltransferase/glycogen phosphorylase [Coccomyxa subellipsoidea C-169]|eukprot:XP_005646742.1 UDP-Glycosyltransferase/glycogen phosphorylase [Coccomyxa subellipsoidea C-169]